MASAKDVDYNQQNSGQGVSVDGRQDRGVFGPSVHPDGQRTSDPKGVEVRSAVDYGDVKTDATSWMVFDEQGRDHGGPVSAVTTDILGSGYDKYPGGHNEQLSYGDGLLGS